MLRFTRNLLRVRRQLRQNHQITNKLKTTKFGEKKFISYGIVGGAVLGGAFAWYADAYAQKQSEDYEKAFMPEVVLCGCMGALGGMHVGAFWVGAFGFYRVVPTIISTIAFCGAIKYTEKWIEEDKKIEN